MHRSASCGCQRLLFPLVLLGAACYLSVSTVFAQESADQSTELQTLPAPSKDDLSPAPTKVDINPIARDEEISQRLQRVLDATGWFTNPDVRVEQGVVFLSGRTDSEELKKWAGELSRNTQDVVAVANRMEVDKPSVWDFRPAWTGLLALWSDIVRSIPFFAFGMLIIVLSVVAAMLTTRAARGLLVRRVRTRLLQNVLAYGVGLFAFLLGVYIVLRVSGLTQLALTVVGGTGLIGLAVGIAFRDITENFLASIFLSMQQPFESGDLVEVAGVTGYVQQLNVRTTILMTLDGNIVQIPNASVYKSNIRNFTTNANRREGFEVGIGYNDSIIDAQEIARRVLADHPAVLNDPEPSVLVDSLGRTAVILHVHFWLNGREHSWLKVRSSVIRLVKLAFQKQGLSMPDEAREVVFPKQSSVTMPPEAPGDAPSKPPEVPISTDSPHEDPNAVSTKAEAGLYSESVVIEEQARKVQPLKDGENLLQSASAVPSSKRQGS